ncbi:7-carboxy-7-deazaguanine synthase [Micromonospora palythoicola]|uniref:7-carboxy-7-deazaguanine synthase n=1 Tax=Micromonospora palythoicola TaxID=3120507 RepID=UPI002FCE3E98
MRQLRLLPAPYPRICRARHVGSSPRRRILRSAYRVKEIFYTLQGEGTHAGRPAVFCRFTSCNLWTGREKDRHRAICQFCDTDFVGTDGPGGGRFQSAQDLAAAVAKAWAGAAHPRSRPYVVCTGGEPLLQLDAAAVEALHEQGFEVAIETNGTRPAPAGIEWICVSPKAGTNLVLRMGNELKLVYPQHGAEPERFADLDFGHFLLQPMDGPDQAANTRAAIDYCLAHPQWSLSLQTHKYIGIA